MTNNDYRVNWTNCFRAFTFQKNKMKKPNSQSLKDRARIGAVASAFAGLMIVVSADAQGQQSQSFNHLDQQTLRLIEHYCLASWRNSRIPESDWEDSTQQVFLELLEALTPDEIANAITSPDSVERRELNRAIWRISKRIKRQPQPARLSHFEVSAIPESRRYEELDMQVNQVSEVASSELGPHQRDVVRMLLNGDSIVEIAERLKTSPARVSDVKYRAIKKLRQLLA